MRGELGLIVCGTTTRQTQEGSHGSSRSVFLVCSTCGYEDSFFLLFSALAVGAVVVDRGSAQASFRVLKCGKLCS
jgi:hypothetical protein